MPTEPPDLTNPGPSPSPGRRGGWGLALFSLVLGGVLWVAAWTGGHPGLGLAMFVIMACFTAFPRRLAPDQVQQSQKRLNSQLAERV